MHLAQREREHALLRRLYEGCAYGRSYVVHVTGPVGSGKSTLLNDFVSHVTASGGLHLPVSGVRSEQKLPLGLINQIMEATSLEAIEPTEKPFPHVAEGLPTWLVTRLKELYHTLREVADRSPLFLHIDDAHLMDSASAHCLLYVLRRLHGTSVMTVVTRCSSQGTIPRHLTALARLPQSTGIQLAPLGVADVQALLSEHCPEADAEAVTDLMRYTGGIPALVSAALEDHRIGSEEPHRTCDSLTDPTPGAAYSTALSEYLHRHEPATMEMAKTLAIMGEARIREGAQALLPPHRTEATPSLEKLQAAGILNADGFFRHPKTQAAVLQLMGPKERAETHLRCARALREYDAPVGLIAQHLRHAEHVSDPWAIPLLQEAGEQALSKGDITFAIDSLSSAARFCTDSENKPRIALTLASMLWRVDPEAASRHLLRLSGDAVAGRLPADDLYTLVRGLLWAGHRSEAEQVLRHLPKSVREDPTTTSNVEMRITRSICATNHPEVTHLLPEPCDRDEVIDIPRITTPMLRLSGAESLAMTLFREDHHEAVAMAEEVLANASLGEHMVEAVFAALSTLIYADRLDHALYWSESLINMSGRRSLLWRAQAHMLRAEVALRTGELGMSHHHATIAMSLLPRPSWGTAIGLPLSHLLQVAEVTGDREAATRIVTEPISEELFRSRYGLHFLYARGHHHLDAGRVEVALSDFSACGELMRKWELDNPALVPWRGGAAQAQLRLGNSGAAQALVSEQAALVDPSLTRTRGLSLLDMASVLTRVERAKERVTVLEEAVRLLDQVPDFLHAAQGRTELADALEVMGEEDKACSLREQARASLDRNITPPDVQNSEGARSIDPPASSPPQVFDKAYPTAIHLSRAEHRVASLAAEGLTNRQISARLHITVSTVEQHLTRIYRKLDVSDRQRIADILTSNTDVTLQEALPEGFEK